MLKLIEKRRMIYTIISGLCFCTLTICTTILEIKGFQTTGLWIIIALWVFFGFGNKY